MTCVVVPIQKRTTYHTSQHLVQQSTQTPIVHRKRVSLPQQYFRGKVLGCTTEGLRHAIVIFIEDLGQAEISQNNMAVISNQNVFRL